MVATPEQVVVTHGAAHAVDLLARVLLRPGDVAAVEEPGYPPVANLLRTLGVEVIGVPVDEHGLVVDALPGNARLVHVTPSHQYPLGVVLSRERRLALLRWASATVPRSSRTTTTASSATPPGRSSRCTGWTGTAGSSTSARSARS